MRINYTERWRLEKARRLKTLLETGELAGYVFPKQVVAQRLRREREALQPGLDYVAEIIKSNVMNGSKETLFAVIDAIREHNSTELVLEKDKKSIDKPLVINGKTTDKPLKNIRVGFGRPRKYVRPKCKECGKELMSFRGGQFSKSGLCRACKLRKLVAKPSNNIPDILQSEAKIIPQISDKPVLSTILPEKEQIVSQKEQIVSYIKQINAQVYQKVDKSTRKAGRPKVPNDQKAVRLLNCVGCGKPIHIYRKCLKPEGNHCVKCWGRILGTRYHPLISGSIRPPRKEIVPTVPHKIVQSVKYLGPIKCDGHTCASCKDPFGENCPIANKDINKVKVSLS